MVASVFECKGIQDQFQEINPRVKSNIGVERYRSPESGNTTTIVLAVGLRPRSAIFIAALIAAPQLIPQMMPSSRAESRCHFDRFFVSHLNDFVDQRCVENVGDETGTDSLNLVLSGTTAGKNRAVFRFDSDDFHIGLLLFFQVTADTGDGTSRADARHEVVDVTVGVVPDFRTGRLKVDRGIRPDSLNC